MNEAPRRTIPVGTYLVLALACVLYVAMLLNVHVPAGGGEARIANAYQVLFLTLWLWVVLAVLLVMCGVMGEMRAAEGYLLELLAWCAFADRSIIDVAGDNEGPHQA